MTSARLRGEEQTFDMKIYGNDCNLNNVNCKFPARQTETSKIISLPVTSQSQATLKKEGMRATRGTYRLETCLSLPWTNGTEVWESIFLIIKYFGGDS